MAKNLFVGNLPWSVNDDALMQMFSAYGTVVSAKVISDRATGRSKGYGFVEMAEDSQAQEAIAALNGSDQAGRPIVVKEALPRPEKTA